ncbi:Subtilisin-like serine proteases [Variovorax sp. HW608]|uniref:S8 family serine peptidase n=1 Tax=Variovorax sp. HW608 TaxID=1034889 RepID=UPI00081FB504|nr:S8 family serine peptidase [Variovorax sp. HW608]SCK21941.1 Subtilisin-like serine proteases [Variovorax sp. HW608]
MKVLIQTRSNAAMHAAAMAFSAAPELSAHLENAVDGLVLDATYPPVQVPGSHTVTGAAMHSLSQPMLFSFAAQDSTYLVRGHIPDGAQQQKVIAAALAHPDVVGVFSDPTIEGFPTCGGDAAVGTSKAVATKLPVSKLAAAKMTGAGVSLAIVDTGINLAYLKTKGVTLKIDVANSFVPAGVATTPGKQPVNHGTMCAFDAAIAAPKATYLDHAVLLSTTPGANQMAGLLSDAVLAYQRLRTVVMAMPAAKRALVVSNSWGMFAPASDFPPGHPGNYSDNPNHPFNIIVASLESAGADVLFAAGNCGRDCPDGRCGFGNQPSICGANSHPSVLSIAGVDLNKKRVGYSSQGPGRLTAKKPDVATFTHFTGSGVFSPDPDSGTSAACPVAAGVVAAIRSKYPSSKLSPMQLRALIYKTAADAGNSGFDFDYGYGILDASALVAALP